MRRYIIDALAALLVTALLCAIVYLIICLAQLANAARGAVEALPGRVDAAIAREAEATRAVLHAEAGAWRRMVDQQATAARRAAQDESAAYRGTLDARAGEIIGQAAAELRDTRLLLEGPAAELESTLAEYRRVPALVGQRLDPWTDCRGNGACWQAQATAFLGAARVTAGRTSTAMREIEQGMPRIVANIDRTTDNVARMTKPDSLGVRAFKLVAPVAGGILFGAIK